MSSFCDNLRCKKSTINGFTLLEIIIVIIIVGILASLSMPKFIRTIEYARGFEALAHLGAIRRSLDRYYIPARNYTGANINQLDIDDPNNSALYPNHHFAYTLTVDPGGMAYTAQAQRNILHGGDGSSSITIDQNGTKTGSGVYSSIR